MNGTRAGVLTVNPRPGGKKPQARKGDMKVFPPTKLAKIQFDPLYTREVDPIWANKIAKGISAHHDSGKLADTVNPIIVSEREDSSLWCIDGHHRIVAAINRNVNLRALVQTGLSIKEEANIYLNNQKVKRESPSRFFDVSAPINPWIRNLKKFFDDIAPGWNSHKIGTITRMEWASCLNVIDLTYAGANKNTLESIAISFETPKEEYLRQSFSILKKAYGWKKEYGKNRKSQKIFLPNVPMIWQCHELLRGALICIVKFHQRHGNCKNTNEMLVEFFSRMTDADLEKIYKKVNQVAQRGAECAPFASLFMIGWYWNFGYKIKNNKRVPYPSNAQDISVKPLSDNKLPYEDNYMTLLRKNMGGYI